MCHLGHPDARSFSSAEVKVDPTSRAGESVSVPYLLHNH